MRTYWEDFYKMKVYSYAKWIYGGIERKVNLMSFASWVAKREIGAKILERGSCPGEVILNLEACWVWDRKMSSTEWLICD